MAAEEGTMSIRILKLAGASALALALLAACGGETPVPEIPEPEVVAKPAPPIAPDYASFVATPGRIDGDAAKDGSRKPAEVLAFSKVMTGATVLELEAGAGYYTELLSRVVLLLRKVHLHLGEDVEHLLLVPRVRCIHLGALGAKLVHELLQVLLKVVLDVA
jgi:hypothetical protein